METGKLMDMVEVFEGLEDWRNAQQTRHRLSELLTIAVCAVLSGADDFEDISQWGRMKLSWLRGFLSLDYGIASPDTFERVFAVLDPKSFERAFREWVAGVIPALRQEQVIAIDGKTSRRTTSKAAAAPLHMVSAFAAEVGLVLGQVATDQKSNEITAIPELLKLVDIQGSIITIDAMGTQKAIAAVIIEREADYVLALKGNQGKLHDAVINHIDRHEENDFAEITVRSHTTMEKGHGREEIRSYFHMAVPRELPGLEEWPGLRTIGKVISVCMRDGKETVETRHYISSLAVGVKQFAHAVRSHWGIENSCHWSLDMTFREDESRIRDKQMRENVAWLYLTRPKVRRFQIAGN